MENATTIEGLETAGRLFGIDAGGSATKVAIVEAGKVTERWEVEPLNAALHPNVRERLAKLIGEVRPDAAGVGLPGIATEERARTLGVEIQADCAVAVQVATDLTIAWLGAFLGNAGIVVAAGTGSFAIGGLRRDALERAGGRGYLLGDEGGAYWLGKRAVQAALADLDGTGPATALGAIVEEHTARSLPDFVRFVHEHPTDRSLLAELAPLVCAAAETVEGPKVVGPQSTAEGHAGLPGDPVANGIVAEAADALAALVRPLRERFGPLPVAATGGTLTGLLRRRLNDRITCGEPAAEPVIGAVLLAATDTA